MTHLPVSAPDLGELEEQYLLDAFRSSWISSTGPYVDRFEREFADFAGTKAAIAVSNGTVALHLAMLGLGVEPGDEVIVPSLTYIATANAVRYVGAEPVFVDVEPDTWCIDPAAVTSAISTRTRGIIAVHLYGHPADMDTINAIASRHGLWVVEDAAEAHGARYRGRPVGSLATMATFSFYGNKIMTSGEGGAITVDDQELERRMRLFRGQGMDPNQRYYFPVIGHNFRMTNVACALLCAQLERFDAMAGRRGSVCAEYERALRDVEGIGLQLCRDWAQPARWLFSITVDQDAFGKSRDELGRSLAARGIETRPFFRPIHHLPPYRDRTGSQAELPVTDHLGRTGMSLPTFSQMTSNDVRRVVEAIATIGAS